jgi:carboxyl-terminal processing protease
MDQSNTSLGGWQRVGQLILLLPIAVSSFSGLGWAATPGELKNSPKTLVDEVWLFVNRFYVDPKFNKQDWQAVRTDLLSRRYSNTEQAYNAIRNLLSRFNDPYTRFLPAPEFSALLKQTTGEQMGVGLDLSFVEKKLQVASVTAGSPAEKAGMQTGDQILSINRRSTRNLTLEQANKLMQGYAGTPLVLVIVRQQKDPISVNIVRDGPIPKSVEYRVVLSQGDKIGYIRLKGFNAHSAQEVSEAIAALTKEQVKGFVLDLRNNPGGLLDQGLEIADQWLERGVIVQILDRKGKTQEIRAKSPTLSDLPLVVLVNRQSASASEILAGALQENQRAKVVGSPTFGKALVQALHELTDGSAIVITVAHYYTPKGIDISQTGIKPDVALLDNPITEQLLRTSPLLWGSPGDPTFARALEILGNQIRPGG